MMTYLNDMAAGWAQVFGSMVVQNTAYLLVVLMLLRVLRGFPARLRAVIATVGLVKMLVPPFLSWEMLRGENAASMPAQVSGLLFPFQGIPAGQEVMVGRTAPGLELATLIFLVWAVVVACRLGWAALATVDLRRQVARAWLIPTGQVPAFITRAGVQVWQTRGVSMPLTLGLRPRRIYVPLAWDQWSRANRERVLRHELAHIRHHDGMFRALEILVQSVYFFHPLVGVLVNRLNILREMACDDKSVTPNPRSRLEYSRFLINLAETALARPVASESASTLLRRKSELMNRVTYQMKEGVMKNVSKKVMGLVLLVLLASALPLSLVYGEKKAPPPPPPPPPAKMELVEVALGEDSFTVDGKDTSYASLAEDLKKAVAGREGKVVVAIKAAPDLPMGKLHRLQKELQQMDIHKVVYTGEPGKKLAMVLPTEEQEMKMKQVGEDMVVGLMVDGQGLAHLSGMKHGDKSGLKPEKAVALIMKIAQENEHLIVDLQTTSETPYQAMIEVLGLLKQSGLKRIHIADPVS
jgi:beta-lactamase regulating signal transducer with metallopeptidase domain